MYLWNKLVIKKRTGENSDALIIIIEKIISLML